MSLGSQETVAYDLFGRLKTYTPPVGLTSGQYVSYDYNNAGQKTKIQITDGTTTPYDVTYHYFANAWLEDVKYGADTVASFTYDVIGNRLTQTNGNGTSTEYAYDTASGSDPRYFLNSITHKHGTDVLATIDYTSTPRDNAGNPKSMTDWTGTWSYDYDANNRLTTATPPNPIPDQPAGGTYDYDWVGNRIHPPAEPNPMLYNKADQLTLWPGMHSYTYYGDGSLKEEKNAVGAQVMKSYTHTPDGLLSTATFDGKTLTNFWDADKNRIGFTVGSTNHTFVYDTTAGTPAVVKEDGVYYVRDPEGALLARVDGSSRSFYHFDQLGSTRLLTDSTGTMTDKWAYDAYGALVAREHAGSEPTGEQPYQYVGRLGYYSQWQEPRVEGLVLGRREYAPEIGRFLQCDPSGRSGGLNLYEYVNSEPVNRVDPSGLHWECSPGGQPCWWVPDPGDGGEAIIRNPCPDPMPGIDTTIDKRGKFVAIPQKPDHKTVGINWRKYTKCFSRCVAKLSLPAVPAALIAAFGSKSKAVQAWAIISLVACNQWCLMEATE